MKNMNIISITFLLVIVSIVMKSQDTIYFKDKSIISSKIIEIGITEIQYHRFDNLTGPIYSVLKKDIKSVKYSNGEIDSVSFIVLQANANMSSEKYHPEVGESKLQLRGVDLFYEGNKLGVRKTNQLIKSNALTENQRNIITEIKNMKMTGKAQKGIGTALFISGFAVPAVVSFVSVVYAFDYANNNVDYAVKTIVIGALVGAAIRTTGQVFIKIGKNKAKAKKLEFLSKHNNNEFIY